MDGPEDLDKTSLRQLKTFSIALVGGILVEKVTETLGLAEPLAVVVGLGTTALLLDLYDSLVDGNINSKNYPPKRAMDI